MKLSTSLNNFKKIHKKRNNQTIYYSENCKDYKFIENPSGFISQPKILLYCFVVGFFIWLFNELNNRSDATILYPINFKYEDSGELFVVV